MCEKQPDRQKLLTFRYTYPGYVHLRTTPIFKDMKDLWQGHGLDYLTGNVKAVPEARFLFVSRGLLSGNCFKNLRLSMQGWWPWFM